MTTIYVDNAATTKTSRTAIEAMLPYMDKIYGNPSSLHSAGQEAAEALHIIMVQYMDSEAKAEES